MSVSVPTLPRRVAHATHALLTAWPIDGGPQRAGEVCVYDREALGPREARRFGLVINICGSWVATDLARGLERALEDRYLAETEGDDA